MGGVVLRRSKTPKSKAAKAGKATLRACDCTPKAGISRRLQDSHPSHGDSRPNECFELLYCVGCRIVTPTTDRVSGHFAISKQDYGD